MKSALLTPIRLRLILSLTIVLALAGIAVGFYFTYGWLRSYANDVSSATAEAASGQENVQALQRVQRTLKDEGPAIERAKNIVAESKSYQYQEQVITDLSQFATETGVVITDFNFVVSSGKAGTSSATTATGPLIAAGSGGLKSTIVNVTLKTPTDYKNLLKFMLRIEDNVTRMQISRLSLTKDASTGGIATDILAIEVYMR